MQKLVGSLAVGIMLLAGGVQADAVKNPLKNGETWADLKGDVIGDIKPLAGADLFTVDAPYRAHDAATVPIHIRQDTTSSERITRMVIVVDENPAPVVADFELGAGIGHLDMETRVRVDQYSNIRVIAETANGDTYMNGRFVKASGGCSAPALKDMESSIANAGKMRLKLFDPATETSTSTSRKQVKVMIRHPNFSGMQRNQVTQLFIPAFFVDELEVFQGEERMFRMEGGISISEDPVFRFSYIPNGATEFRVRATDTEGNIFERTFPIGNDA